MPSRELTFHQEIRDAVASHDRLVLVVGPEAVRSDYVSQEWRFAYFEAAKCVNPIVRLNGKNPEAKLIDGYSLIPEDLQLIDAEDFRKEEEFDAHLSNLVRQLNEPLPPVGKLVGVPELPSYYLEQHDRLNQIRDILLVDLRKPVVVTGAAGCVGLLGMGGVGKSVLASALAHRTEVRLAFPDGIYWVVLGQQAKLDTLQRQLASQLGDQGLFVGVELGKQKLRELLAKRAALLILDDVWAREAADAFNVVGPRGRLLLTTRDAGLVTAFAASENHFPVQLPSEAEARGMLASASGVTVQMLPQEADEVIAECGRLPSALALCGGMVRSGSPWADMLDALRDHDLQFLSDSHPAEAQHESIWKAIDLSIRVLPEDEQERIAELAVFAVSTGAPELAVETLWGDTAGLKPREARKLLADLAQRSLVRMEHCTSGDIEGHMTVNNLVYDFVFGMALKQFGSLAALHVRLLDAYRKRCPNGWASGPDDGYFRENLCSHLLEAGKKEDAVSLLTNLLWVEAKCCSGLVFSLEEDYRTVIAALPEAQPELIEEEHRKAELARWTATLENCGREKESAQAGRGDSIDRPVERRADRRRMPRARGESD